MIRIVFIFLGVSIILISCSKPEARKPIVRKTSSFIEESVNRNKILNKVEEDLLRYKMQNDSLHEYINSKNGFWYYFQLRDSLKYKFPVKGDEIVLTYEIKNLQDSILYSKEEIGIRNYLVDKEELITGLQDGIKLMKEGEIATFLFPSYKAYGYTGYDKIKPNEPLIYTVQIIKINNNKNENANN
jgi:gliding motility-associated peptidyl-prolyl isomerase